jgi:hypothetical protein
MGGSGARRRNNALDEVSAAILGDAVAENGRGNRQPTKQEGFPKR